MMPVQTLHVTGIPVDIDKEDLKIIFSPYGNVHYTFCAAPRDPSSKTCFGFVEFSTVKEAEYAMQELNGKPPYKFHISFAKQTRSNKDKRKQNQISEGTNIRITAFGNRREITLFNPYSDRDNMNTKKIELIILNLMVWIIKWKIIVVMLQLVNNI